MVRIDECKVDGIILSIDMIIQHYNIHLANNDNATCCSLCDSVSATEYSQDFISPAYLVTISRDTKILFPVERDIGISYCRLLLHDTMLKDD